MLEFSRNQSAISHGASRAHLLRVEATDSQASILEQRLTELDTPVLYQEEQHSPTLVVCLRFRPYQESALRRILGEIGLRVRGEIDRLTA
jgi:hypothetical protein